MENPELYSKMNDVQKIDANYVLDNYFRLIKCKPNESYMDVGCGSGDVTLELLLPRLPSNFSKLVGSDISDSMIEASRYKTKDERVVFRTFDIAAKSLPEEFKGKFNHIFSFYCLHWVQDQRAAYQNMFNMLTPGSNILVTYLAENPVFEIYHSLADYSKWIPYMENWERFLSPFHRCKDTETKVEKLLSSVGFVSHMCKVETRSYTYPTINVFKKSIMAICPFVQKMEKEDSEDFMQDFVNELEKTKNVVISDNNNERQITLHYDLLTVFASKPF